MSTKFDDLPKLSSLKEKCVITPEEFEIEKKKIMN